MSTIAKRLQKAKAEYIKQIESIAFGLFSEKVIPVCRDLGLVYGTINGFPRFYRQADGGQVAVPSRLRQLFNVDTDEGDPLYWHFPDYSPDGKDLGVFELAAFESRPKISTNDAALSCWQAMHR